MTGLIRRVIGLWRGADGAMAEVVYDGNGPFGPDSWLAVDALLAPKTHYQTVIELDIGERVLLSTNEIADILPDRTGVLVVFGLSKTPPLDMILFGPPHNAAIFNADGSLRFQLKNPWGEAGVFRAVVQNHRSDGSVELGVRACPKSYPVCETVYVVDGSTDNLGKQLPRWVRD